MKEGMGESKSVDQRRAAMPVTAAFIDLCRTRYAAFVDVDAQLATALKAQREYVAVLAAQGEAAARRWHKANAHRCTFVAQENGRTVGMPSPYGKGLEVKSADQRHKNLQTNTGGGNHAATQR